MSHLPFFLECCCQSADDARRAEVSGASRIELCEELPVDGLTPSDANILATLEAVTIPVNVLVRCRAGNFVYTDEEIALMAGSIEHIRQLTTVSADGVVRRVNAVVIGALTADGDVDRKAMATLLAAAWGEGVAASAASTRLSAPHQEDLPSPSERLAVTFHRAFDVCRDPLQAYADIAALGIDRILTSGHAPASSEGAELLARLVTMSRQHSGPVILVGGGVRPHNIGALRAATAADEFHSSCLAWKTDSPGR